MVRKKRLSQNRVRQKICFSLWLKEKYLVKLKKNICWETGGQFTNEVRIMFSQLSILFGAYWTFG